MLREYFALGIIVSVMLCIIPDPTLAGAKSSYALALEGKNCETSALDQTISCEYIVGTGLTFAIVGIGLPDTAITFMKSSFDGDFYATFGLLHGCVIIKRGTKGVESEDAFEPGGIADFALCHRGTARFTRVGNNARRLGERRPAYRREQRITDLRSLLQALPARTLRPTVRRSAGGETSIPGNKVKASHTKG